MRALAIPVLLAATLAGAAPLAPEATDGPRVVTRRGAVYVDGEAAWRGRRLESKLVWSRRRDAVAFTARDRAGRRTLVAVVFPEGAAPTTLSWRIPRHAEPAHVVTWLGPTRLGAGPSVLEPRVIASFTMLRSSP